MRSQYAALMDELVKRWSSSEACHLPLEGCSEAEIEEITRCQGVERLPEMYVEFLRRMGRKSGGLGSDFYPDVLESKHVTFPKLQHPDIFVLTHDFDADCAVYFQVNEDDPVLYWIGYDSSRPQSYDLITKSWGRLSSWLVNLVEGIIEAHEVIKKRGWHSYWGSKEE